MKLAIIAVLLLSAPILSQEVDKVQTCIGQLQSEGEVFDKVSTAFHAHEFGRAIHMLVQAGPQIRKIHNACNGVTPQDIAQFALKNMNDEQKTCLNALKGVFASLHSLLNQETDSHWAEPFKAIHKVITYLEEAKPKCPPSILAALHQ